MKILHVANFSWFNNSLVYYSIDRKISNGLIRNGYFVYDFSYRDISRYSSLFKSKKLGIKAMNMRLIETVNNFEPDIILFGHSELILSDTMKMIKNKRPNIKMALWWVDWLENIQVIQEKVPYLDVIFTTTGIRESQKKISNKIHIEYMPNMCDSSIDEYKAFEVEKVKYDIFYAGRYDKNRENIVEYLNLLSSKYKIGLFGLSKETLLLGHQFIKTIGSSKIAINFSRDNGVYLYSSDRIVQLTANGVLVFSPRIPGFEKIFNDNEIIYFDSIDELDKKLNYYLNHYEEYVKIAKAGYEKTHLYYNSTVVTKFMIETIQNIEYSSRYIWLDKN